MLGKNKKGSLSPHFSKQLRSLSGEIPRMKQIEFVLALPANSRFPYLDKNFLYNEVHDAFNNVCQTKVKVLSIKPNLDDDHYIEICVSIQK